MVRIRSAMKFYELDSFVLTQRAVMDFLLKMKLFSYNLNFKC